MKEDEGGGTMSEVAATQVPQGRGNGGAGGSAIAADRLVKNYGHVRALRSASFEAFPGQVTALVGDNGAGKSTLVKCLAGVIQPGDGQISVRGKEVAMTDPLHATDLGIETVHQDLALAP